MGRAQPNFSWGGISATWFPYFQINSIRSNPTQPRWKKGRRRGEENRSKTLIDTTELQIWNLSSLVTQCGYEGSNSGGRVIETSNSVIETSNPTSDVVRTPDVTKEQMPSYTDSRPREQRERNLNSHTIPKSTIDPQTVQSAYELGAVDFLVYFVLLVGVT